MLLASTPFGIPMWIAAGAALVGGVSFIDDRSHVPAPVRLVVHAGASTLVVFMTALPLSASPENEWLHSLIAPSLWILFCVWMTNLYNFMDGIDGLAGGMGVFGFGTLGFLGYLSGDVHVAVAGWIIAAATTGFLVWNFPPARIFMGDTGSATLGFLAATLSFEADTRGSIPISLSLLLFIPFIADASITLVRRILKREKIWLPHRSHYYQRLVRAGWSHRRTVLWEYGVMFLCAVLAIFSRTASPGVQMSLAFGVCGLLVVAIFAVCQVETTSRVRTRAGETANDR